MIHLFFNTVVGEVKGLTPDELRQLRRNAADGVLECTRDHLLALPGESFYREAAQSMERVSTAQADEVCITQRGIALQYYGGTVKAGKGISSKTGEPTKYLSIPVSKATKEMPGRYPDLSFFKYKKGTLALVQLDQDGKPTPVFWLVEQATIKPHPNILPKQEQLQHAAKESSLDYLETLTFYRA